MKLVYLLGTLVLLGAGFLVLGAPAATARSGGLSSAETSVNAAPHPVATSVATQTTPATNSQGLPAPTSDTRMIGPQPSPVPVTGEPRKNDPQPRVLPSAGEPQRINLQPRFVPVAGEPSPIRGSGRFSPPGAPPEVPQPIRTGAS